MRHVIGDIWALDWVDIFDATWLSDHAQIGWHRTKAAPGGHLTVGRSNPSLQPTVFNALYPSPRPETMSVYVRLNGDEPPECIEYVGRINRNGSRLVLEGLASDEARTLADDMLMTLLVFTGDRELVAKSLKTFRQEIALWSAGKRHSSDWAYPENDGAPTADDLREVDALQSRCKTLGKFLGRPIAVWQEDRVVKNHLMIRNPVEVASAGRWFAVSMSDPHGPCMEMREAFIWGGFGHPVAFSDRLGWAIDFRGLRRAQIMVLLGEILRHRHSAGVDPRLLLGEWLWAQNALKELWKKPPHRRRWRDISPEEVMSDEDFRLTAPDAMTGHELGQAGKELNKALGLTLVG